MGLLFARTETLTGLKNTRVASCLPTFRGTERFVYATQYGLYKLLRHVHSVLQ